MTDKPQLGIPKPTKADRPKRPPKASTRPARDPAQPDNAALIAIWTEWPRCVLTDSHQGVSFHHALGRGESFGFQWKHPERAWFSSPFAVVPLRGDIHHGPYRDAPEMRALFLRIAEARVMAAVRSGSYELTANDEHFRTLAGDWLRDHR